MDTETYEQTALTKAALGESAEFLKDGMEVKLTFYNTEPIDIELPSTVDLEVVEAEVAVRGDIDPVMDIAGNVVGTLK